MHLTDYLVPSVIPIGLIHVGIGGSRIEQWMPWEAWERCISLTSDNQNIGELFYGMTAPYVNFTIRQVIWYQGENDARECCDWSIPVPEGGPNDLCYHQPIQSLRNTRKITSRRKLSYDDRIWEESWEPKAPLHHRRYGGASACGNSIIHAGYGCGIIQLIRAWRRYWRDENLPVATVTLAGATFEGAGSSAGPFRWSQTGNYGIAPNPEMKNVVIVHAYDLTDPCVWGNAECVSDDCETYPFSTHCVHPYMGAIHPRVKSPLGKRIAFQSLNLFYKDKTQSTGPYNGPFLKGCTLDASSHTIRLDYDETRFGGDTLQTPKYNFEWMNSGVSVHVNGNRTYANSQNFGTPILSNITRLTNTSILVHIPQAVNVSEVTGINYAWSDTACCGNLDLKHNPCPVEQCPIKLSNSGLPAEPFFALIVNNKCKCILPQKCDG